MTEITFTDKTADFTRLADAVNLLADWLAADERPEDNDAKADAVVLVGGTILAGADRAADLVKSGAAPELILVGGEGHTTPHLRRMAEIALGKPEGLWKDASEAEVLTAYLEEVHGVTPLLSEGESLNSGENAASALRLASEANLAGPLIITQDATMQRRILATLEHQRPDGVYISAPSPMTQVIATEDGLAFADTVTNGMWTMGEYLDLLSGEIPRLRNDAHGYGPNGAGFIAAVDVPDEVEGAHSLLVSAIGRIR